MKIAYIMHSFDNSNAKKAKELGWFITKSIERQGVEIEYIEARSALYTFYFRVRCAVLRKLGYRTNWFREPFLLKRLANSIEKQLKKSDCDAVFSFGSIPIAFITTDKPIVFWTDASFASLVERHPHVTQLRPSSLQKANDIECDAFNRAHRIIFTSEWAAKETLNNYEVSNEKLKVVTFGPNVADLPSSEEIAKVIKDKAYNELHLLWLAINWELKDGPKALAIARELNKSVKTTIHIVGVPQPINQEEAPFARFYGFLYKGDPAEAQQLSELYKKCHFLVHPTKFDTLGQVLIEANSWGMPAVTHAVGGVPEVIQNGVNGLIYDPKTDVETIAKDILYLFKDVEAYKSLCLDARTDYDNRTSWDAAAKNVVEIIWEAINRHNTRQNLS